MNVASSQNYRRVNFTKDDFGKLDKTERVLLALLSYVISETNALWRIFLCVKQNTCGVHVVDAGVAIQRHVILRTWSAKLFEFDHALGKLLGRRDLTSELRDFIETLREIFIDENENNVPKLVQYFRHEATNHSPVKAAMKNLDHISDSADLNFYFHKSEANSVFPLGEEVFFAARYNRFLKGNPKNAMSDKPFREWLEWTQCSTKKLIYQLDQFMCRFVFSDENPISWEELEVMMSQDLAATFLDRQVPILLTEDYT